MAFIRIVETQQWIGPSLDASGNPVTKPAGATPGSKVTESDTGKQWIYDGTNWVEDLTLIYALSRILEE
jgi:hypothetical protein